MSLNLCTAVWPYAHQYFGCRSKIRHRNCRVASCGTDDLIMANSISDEWEMRFDDVDPFCLALEKLESFWACVGLAVMKVELIGYHQDRATDL